MLSQLFLGMSLIGAEWVMYVLLGLSVLSVAVIFERARFYRVAARGQSSFRSSVRKAALDGKWDEALRAAESRVSATSPSTPSPDLESEMTLAVLRHSRSLPEQAHVSPEILEQLAQDAVIRARLGWDRNLAILGTIGANAPFIGLFGTVLGIIKAFHDLSLQGSGGAQTVTAGISEALVATAIGLLVAIPAAIAFNIFQRRVKAALAEAEALKSFLIGKLAR